MVEYQMKAFAILYIRFYSITPTFVVPKQV